MDRQHIRDNGIIERYLQGTLTAAEEEAFEEAYLGDPELLEELELAQRLRAAIREAHEVHAATRSRTLWAGLVSAPRFGLAASIVAAAALVSSSVLYLQNRNLRGSAPGAVEITSTHLVPIVSVRGAGNPNAIAAPAADDWTVLLLDAGFADYDLYSARLVREDPDAEREVASDAGITPSYEGLLAFGVAGRLLTPGDYEIRLSGGRKSWGATHPLDELTRIPLTVRPRS